MDLVVASCRQLCDWTRTPVVRDARPVLACRGCGTQWQRGQAWTPAQADGSVPPAVREELTAAGAAGSAGSSSTSGS